MFSVFLGQINQSVFSLIKYLIYEYYIGYKLSTRISSWVPTFPECIGDAISRSIALNHTHIKTLARLRNKNNISLNLTT